MLFAAGAAAGAGLTWGLTGGGEPLSPLLRFGILTDLHHADKAPAMNRYYRDTRAKTAEAMEFFRQTGISFAVELGDFIDAADTEELELANLKTIDSEYAVFRGDRHYVLGNHCLHNLSKPTFLETVGAEASYYSFDRGPFHFVVLDACFRADGTEYDKGNFDWKDCALSQEEIDWLRADLKSAGGPTYVFVHQRLDPTEHHTVANHAEVRSVLEESGTVVAVFQGHNHINEHRLLGGVHYVTLNALVEGPGMENNAFAVADLYEDGSLRLDGFRTQADYHLQPGIDLPVEAVTATG